jgi:hypothetical protein
MNGVPSELLLLQRGRLEWERIVFKLKLEMTANASSMARECFAKGYAVGFRKATEVVDNA